MERQSKSTRPSSFSRLLARARAGERTALSVLFLRHGVALRRWAHGRLPKWARHFSDTADVVQDVLLRTFRRFDRIDISGHDALQAYLRQAVKNRIRDELKRTDRKPHDDLDSELPDPSHSPFDRALNAEQARRYQHALATMSETERALIVGRFEMGYTYEQLALISGRATADATRVAVRRAAVKLAERMSRA